MNSGVALGREMETAVPRRRVEGYAVSIDGLTLRRAPWGMGRRPDFAAAESSLLSAVLSLLEHLGAKRILIGEVAAMTVEIVAGPLRNGPPDTPAGDKIMAAVTGRHHREGMVADERDQHTVRAGAKRDPGRIRG